MKNRLILLWLLSASIVSMVRAQLYFPSGQDNWATEQPENLGWCTDSISALYDYLEINDTRAFLLLKDGKIVLEKYFYDFDQDSVWYWASAGKTLTAFLTGLAQEQGYISIDDPSSDYLGKWTEAPEEKEQLITIRNHLTMTTGLDDTVDNLDCTEPVCLQYLSDPGTRWSYHNAPYTLVSSLLEEATGQNYNLYSRNELLSKIGGEGIWLRLNYNRVFFSSPRTMARFGLLMLGGGDWDGVSIMNDKDYFNDMITPSQSLNPSYGYLWWLNGQDEIMLPGLQTVFNRSLCPAAPENMIAAMGKNSQLLNVVPDEGLVMVRMGESPSAAPVPTELQNGIWEYLDYILCKPSNQSEISQSNVSIYPNPATGETIVLEGISVENPGIWRLYNPIGLLLQEIHLAPGEQVIQVPSGLSNGSYFYQFSSQNLGYKSGSLILNR